MKKGFAYAVKALLGCLLICITASCALVYNIPGLLDYEIFPYREIKNDSSHIFTFHENDSDCDIGKSIRVNNEDLYPSAVSLEDYIDHSKTAAFLIIRSDTLIYEHYNYGFNESTPGNLFSVTKAFITTLVGIALRDGLLEDVDQHIVDFLPELKLREGFEQITVRHLLTHTSGIKFSEVKYNPFSDNARYYYGRDLRKLALKAKLYCEPGKEVHYSSTNCQLLAMILERATHCCLSEYLEQEIWKKLGMEYCATWNTDHKGVDAMEKGFSCLNCAAIDLAKLGRLYMNNGKWNGEEIIPEDYLHMATSHDTTGGSGWDYQFNFRLGPAKYKSYFSRGLYGQYLYIYPEKNVIIVRFGESDLGYRPDFIQQNIQLVIDQL